MCDTHTHTHTASSASKWKDGGEAKDEGGAIALSKLAAVASGYWSSGGLALLIWFTNRTRRPPHIVTHYYYYSQTLTYSHTHSHTLTCTAVLPQCFWQTHLVHLLHLLRRLPHFNCFCSHTHTHAFKWQKDTHKHTYIHSCKSLSICNLNARHHRLGPFPAHSMRLFDS